MTDRIDLGRFRALAESYGADIGRWPAETREAATMMAQNPAAIAILEEAEQVDTVLDSWLTPEACRSLSQRSAEKASATGLTALRRARMWWAGIGIAAALSGAVTGSAMTAVLMTPQYSSNGTIFGNLDDDGDN
jgi:hypothetical protein